MSQNPVKSTTDPAYKTLYKLGGIAAWLVAFLTVAEIFLFVIFPAPTTIAEWFNLFQDNPLIGLINFWALELPMYLMFVIVFLALYFATRDANRMSNLRFIGSGELFVL